MRYLSWDVLLFPDESRIPIQEFDVKCHALPNSNDHLQRIRLPSVSISSYHSSLTQVPNLTGFVSSLEAGQNFRVSIHSWDKPKASDLLLGYLPAPDRIMFEAKLFIDGQLKAHRYLGEQNGWPEVIDKTGGPIADLSKPLRFPPFHVEILQQSHWDARDGLGRIRVVIAEGLARETGSNRGFKKLRDIVVFSFQHAPRKILEHSGIAWPNARMFARSSTPVPTTPATSFDAHAHSPPRLNPSAAIHQGNSVNPKSSLISMHSAGTWTRKSTSGEDPFVDPAQSMTVPRHRQINIDVAMTDAGVSRDQSEMSGVAMQQPDFQQQVKQAAVEELIRALTPTKRNALLNALSPSKQPDTAPASMRGGTAKPAMHSRVQSMRTFEPKLQAQSANSFRKSSSDSRRSVSGQSTTMSWDETPTLSDLWSGNGVHEFPGLLPSIQSSETRRMSDSIGSKRKRSLSPVTLESTASGTLGHTSGMSTSPCKKTPSPAKDNRIEVGNEGRTVGERQKSVTKVST